MEFQFNYFNIIKTQKIVAKNVNKKNNWKYSQVVFFIIKNIKIRICVIYCTYE